MHKSIELADAESTCTCDLSMRRWCDDKFRIHIDSLTIVFTMQRYKAVDETITRAKTQHKHESMCKQPSNSMWCIRELDARAKSMHLVSECHKNSAQETKQNCTMKNNTRWFDMLTRGICTSMSIQSDVSIDQCCGVFQFDLLKNLILCFHGIAFRTKLTLHLCPSEWRIACPQVNRLYPCASTLSLAPFTKWRIKTDLCAFPVVEWKNYDGNQMEVERRRNSAGP